MRRLAVDIIDKATVSYCVRLGKTSTDITIECDAAGLRALKSCIDTTLDDSGLTTCQPSDDTAVALYPTREEEPTYHIIVYSETSALSTVVQRRKLTEFMRHDIESALAR